MNYSIIFTMIIQLDILIYLTEILNISKHQQLIPVVHLEHLHCKCSRCKCCSIVEKWVNWVYQWHMDVKNINWIIDTTCVAFLIAFAYKTSNICQFLSLWSKNKKGYYIVNEYLLALPDYTESNNKNQQ